MTVFVRLLSESDKEARLQEAVRLLQSKDGRFEPGNTLNIFLRDHRSFLDLPGSSFAYWASDHVLSLFRNLPSLKDAGRTVRTTNPSTDDFRFARAWWEPINEIGSRWRSWNKGGGYSPFYRDIDLVIDWDTKRSTYRGYTGTIYRPDIRPANLEYFARPGLTWVYRGARLCVQEMPEDTVISTRGNGIYSSKENLKLDLAILNSSAADYLIKLTLGRSGHPQFDIGDLNTLPLPEASNEDKEKLILLGRTAWSLMRSLDTVTETSHGFLLPAVLRSRLGDYDSRSFENQLVRVRAEIDEIAFRLYNFDDADRAAALASSGLSAEDPRGNVEAAEDVEADESVELVDQSDGLLSWAVGVAFGRFDCRLATGERDAPLDPAPFEPLPTKSPGMLPDGAEPFRMLPNILVEDQGHLHDLARLIEEVVARVDASVPSDVRRWLQREFFVLHLKLYSKSRRKAPIYWPLSTTSGSYTVWLYYPNMTSQTLYTVVNDFIEPKLKQVSRDVSSLRDKGGARSREDEKAFEVLQALELELIELHDTLLRIAPTYRPNHDDGVQITAAPLWSLFTHKPWQKVLKDTWAKLEKGDYDWANIAMAYWPSRVREKCRTDKSLAISHGLEDLYEDAPASKKRAGKRGEVS